MALLPIQRPSAIGWQRQKPFFTITLQPLS
jgi:hypothetical protein